MPLLFFGGFGTGLFLIGVIFGLRKCSRWLKHEAEPKKATQKVIEKPKEIHGLVFSSLGHELYGNCKLTTSYGICDTWADNPFPRMKKFSKSLKIKPVPRVAFETTADEIICAIVGAVLRNNLALLREPWKTNTDFLPVDSWEDNKERLSFSEIVKHLSPKQYETLRSYQKEHIENLEADLDIVKKYNTKTTGFSWIQDPIAMAWIIKENRFETMLACLQNLVKEMTEDTDASQEAPNEEKTDEIPAQEGCENGELQPEHNNGKEKCN